MTALISGSVAYDTIMVFKGRFRDHILPEQVHILNLSFLVDELRKEFGGCAGNIAYNLKLLGADPLPLATVGADFGDYADWFAKWGINQDHIRVIGEHYTAQAYITTDLDDNQITAFHPGAMGAAHEVDVPLDAGVSMAIIAPNGPDGMRLHARQCREAGIPFLFDPGQAMPLFDGEDLRWFVEQATWVAVNDYESRLLTERTGLDLGALASRVEALIVTRGAEGSEIHVGGQKHLIPVVRPRAVEDPTGCGDAYRAGLIYGMTRNLDWSVTGRIASMMGSIKVAHHGTQNHHFAMEDFRAWYRDAFGEPMP
ncbi:MAG: carbohydrate kinase family protein [Ectothiorhodospiraceae bacterium]|nr:carbohydrate kinase family protein [Ectothiorhodospiraceae bacterium]MCH8504291.1 carbohydrate kinase family protein [Ectothiorhodospiraceae bacterium]